MGKATRWLKGLFGMKKEKEHSNKSGPLFLDKEKKHINKSGQLFLDRKEKKQSCKDHQNHISQTSVQGFDSARYSVAEKQNEYNKKAIFSRSLSHGSSRGSLFFGSREWRAAVKIQSFFRGFLARKALRALRGLVKIQALVRGFLVRKRVVATLHSIQALMRAQAVVRSRRARRSFDKENARPKHIHRRKHLQMFDETRNVQHDHKWLHNSGSSRFDPNRVILAIDPHRSSSRSSMSEYRDDMHQHYYETTSSSLPSHLSRRISLHECQHSQDFDSCFNNVNDEHKFFTAHSTPRLSNSSQANTPLAKSVSEETSMFLPYSNCPNYMANTHSSKARVVRSRSAPKQRSDVKKRVPLEEIMATRNSLSSVRMHW
ncbi:protein IQ-domain 26-like [Vicia villosa]|uniref:protein IQ-domain 26-like n=1 Tax=Vicia villosa TaxID=3911 RepID=UPI00273BE8DA|nr:protein IQ-domain 26-like [Vicia villosa]